MNDMEEKRDNKEIRVRLHHIDRGNCTEVWEVQTEKGKPKRYLGRDDGYGPKEWYTLCDAPYGYCERDCHVREDLTLIVCDKDWNEVLRDGTDRERFPESFPSLDEACNEAWSKVVKVRFSHPAAVSGRLLRGPPVHEKHGSNGGDPRRARPRTCRRTARGAGKNPHQAAIDQQYQP